MRRRVRSSSEGVCFGSLRGSERRPLRSSGPGSSGLRPRSRLGAAAWLIVALSLCAACASPPPPDSRYDFFAPADPESSWWYRKIEDWQRRSLAERPVPLRHPSAPDPPRPDRRLDDRLVEFVGVERVKLAPRIFRVALWQGRSHYEDDEPTPVGNEDHWPTYGQLTERDGDDCDGVDLIAYRLLHEFGFPRGELFRAVLRRDSDRLNHMVTLWFEDPRDPWVFDGTGAVTRELVRFSQIQGWTPTAVFNEREQFRVVESGWGSDPLRSRARR